MKRSHQSRVLLLTPSLDCGGAERVIVTLALYLVRSGYQVTVACMLEPKAFVETLRDSNIEVVPLGMSRRSLNLTGIIRVIRLLRTFRPDLVHAHMFHANVLARVLRILWPAPVISTIHNVLESARDKDTASKREWMYRLTDRLGTLTTTISETVTERYVRDGIVPSSRIATIPNSVNTTRFRPDASIRSTKRAELGWAEDQFIWLAVGRLELAKDYPNLITAFAKVASSGHARLAIAGDGRLRYKLHTSIRERNLTDQVTLLGERADIPELMQAADGFVLSSAWEGAPLVVLEACATELPIVATDVGGIRDMLPEAALRLMVPPSDPGNLARSMQEVMALPAKARHAMGQASRNYVKTHFSEDSIGRRYDDLYRRTLKSTTTGLPSALPGEHLGGAA